MNMPSAPVLMFIIAMIYVFFIVRDYYKNDKQLTLRAKIWLWIVFIFLTISLLL